MTTRLRIAFAGTPEFAVVPLAALREAGHALVGVWTQPDRPAGRGHKLAMSAVKQYALAHGLSVHQPASLRDATTQAELRAAAPEVMVVAAYGMLLPRAVLALPRHGCLNIHASLLPRWRGAAPIQRAMLAGDAETGITIMQMNARMDAGDMLTTRRTPIEARDTAQSLHDRLAQLGAQAILDVLSHIGTWQPVAQDPAQVTFAPKLTHAEARLDWTRPAVALARCVRTYNPWPMAYALWQGQPLRIWAAEVQALDTPAQPGEVIACTEAGLDVATGTGCLRITTVQAAGKRAMPAAAFCRGRALIGARLD
ncbi:MAG TPA: methionyl-tRNA formyltransferase [Gammaproteobacteria bacterium]|nr:methionyl-tRNA formyltransferase [Gammaproteobacteria bacterium]